MAFRGALKKNFKKRS